MKRHQPRDFVAEVFEVALQDVFEEEGAVVADVRPLISGGTARVHFDVFVFGGLEGFYFSG